MLRSIDPSENARFSERRVLGYAKLAYMDSSGSPHIYSDKPEASG